VTFRVDGIGVDGVRIGHWTGASTGVTVVLLPDSTVGSGEVRGGAPASRELALLAPERTVATVDAVVFAGGSAFGLATADGVMRFLSERGVGFPTAGGPVPIVPTACVFDLAEPGAIPPGADEGYAAAVAAEQADQDQVIATGRVGAGRGATVGKWRGREHAVAGGIGIAAGRCGEASVTVLAVVNAVGDVIGSNGEIIAGSAAPPGAIGFPVDRPFEEEAANTTLVVVVTDATIDKLACHLVAQSAHDGLARSLHPAHTRFDGDLTIALSTGVFEANVDRLRLVAADLVAEAIRLAP